MALLMNVSHFKSFNIFKIVEFIVGFLNNFNLWVNIINNIFWKSLNKNLNNSGSMYIQRYINNLNVYMIYYHLNILRIWFFHDFLTKIVSKLVYHNFRDYWEHKENKTFSKSFSFFWIFIKCVLNVNLISIFICDCMTSNDFLLKHSASCLIETVEIKLTENLMILSWEFCQ